MIPNELRAKLHLMRAADEALLTYYARDVHGLAEMSRVHAEQCADEISLAWALMGMGGRAPRLRQ